MRLEAGSALVGSLSAIAYAAVFASLSHGTSGAKAAFIMALQCLSQFLLVLGEFWCVCSGVPWFFGVEAPALLQNWGSWRWETHFETIFKTTQPGKSIKNQMIKPWGAKRPCLSALRLHQGPSLWPFAALFALSACSWGASLRYLAGEKFWKTKGKGKKQQLCSGL